MVVGFKKLSTLLLTVCILLSLFGVCASTGAAEVTHTLTFDVQGIGETPAPVTVKDGEKYMYLGQDNVPHADGYKFQCWVTTLDFEPDEVAMSNTAAYLETPVTEDMTLYAIWYKLIDEVDVTVELPVAGDVIGTERYETEDFSFNYQSPRPRAAVTSEGAQVQESFWSVMDYETFWLEDPNDFESVFEGTFENGKTYGVHIVVEPKFGYEFKTPIRVTLNGKPVENFVYSGHDMSDFMAPVLCGTAPATTPASATSDETAPGATESGSGTKGGTNSHAVQTGNVYPAVVMFALLLSAALVVFARRRKKD